MPVSDYIPSYNDVRGVLGVDSVELPDANIELVVFDLALKKALVAQGVTIPGPWTAAITDAVQLFSTYKMAELLLTAVPQLFAKQLTDSKASITRQAYSFDDLKNEIKSKVNGAASDLVDALAGGAPAPAPASTANTAHAAISNPDYDPVVDGAYSTWTQGSSLMRRE